MALNLEWIDEELANWSAIGLRRRLVDRNGPQGPAIEVAGRTFVNFGSNDYLGLAGTRLTSAVAESLKHCGWGSGASPLITGHGTTHAALERELARFEGTEAALLFPSGFAANVGTIGALVGKADVLFSDSKNHASLIDGARLSGARVIVYPHGDIDFLRQMLQQASGFRRRLIVTDGLFSMDGDFAPLESLADLAREHRAMLFVDEAHATGVFGERGRGITEHCGVEELVSVRVGTLSKALGSLGGFVAGPRTLIDWLLNRARPFVFSTAMPEAMAAAGLRALEIVRDEPPLRHGLLQSAEFVRDELRRQGWELGRCESQIIPLFIGAPDLTMKMAARLQDAGLYVPGIRPPSVPEGESLLRISLSTLHTREHLQTLLDALAECRKSIPRLR